MYAEPDTPHHKPHFHAYYQDHVGIYSLDTLELIGGRLPRRQQRLVEAWAELRQAELLADWQRLQQGRRPIPIKPLD
ncbi:MAG: DUF4160 domain-containing protein [Acidobacteria bacterium]|nr:DUF4160 domain-containing protein [Acidobacteriota bacterium]